MSSRFAGVFTRGVAQGEVLGPLLRQEVHGGPPRARSWVDPAAGVGLTALPQSGATRAELPLQSETKRYTLLFSGRIQNRSELQRDLGRARAQSRGRSDAALVLAALEAWGWGAAVERLAGSFAIALWDAETRRLTLLRDRLGIRPLYIYQRPGLIAFGSDVAMLMSMPGIDRVLDPDSLAEYLRYLHVPSPYSIFRGVSRLAPGHVLTLADPECPLPDPVAYWPLDAVARDGVRRPFPGPSVEAIAALEQMLETSIRDHVPSNGSLGAFLSGGVDSTAVVAVAQQTLGRRLPTFSIGFEDEDYNEARYAAEIAAYLQTAHTELVLTERDMLEVVPEMSGLNDEPIGNPAQVPLYLACRLARREVATMLSGEGGDELFAGYNRYLLGERIIGRANRLPRFFRRGLAAGIEALQPSSWDRLYRSLLQARLAAPQQHGWGARLHKVAALLHYDSAPLMYRSLLSAWQRPEQIVVGASERAHSGVDILDDASFSLLDRMLLHDQSAYLPDEALAKTDRVVRATGLEIGAPLLDHRIVEFSWRLPRAMKLGPEGTKWILRQVLYRRVPRKLVERPKMGFSVPIARWLRGGLRPLAEELLSGERLKQSGLLRPDPIRRGWKGFLTGQSSEATGLWAVLMFQLWWEHWCKDRQPAEVLR